MSAGVTTAATVALVAAVVGAPFVAGAWRWRRLGAALRGALDAAASAASTGPTGPARRAPPSAQELARLPTPVQRYFQAALRGDARRIEGAHIAHAGRFNLSAAGERWVRFTSQQQVTMARPGFVWDARIALAPGLVVRVHDAYVAGEGMLRAALLGLFDLARLRDRGETARGELMRYLAEAAWTPTALWPGPNLRWDPLDERAARVTLGDGDVSVALAFRFGADGLIESVRADARGRSVGRRIVPTPWEGRWSDWREHDGVMLPFSGEVAWLLPEGRRPYWRGTITSLAFRRAD